MNTSAIADVVGPAVEQSGLEIDRIEITRAGKRSVLRVHLDGDGPDGRGPSLDEIADATRAISAALDASPATGEAPYTLEVSSRGVTRPLTEAKHFRRNTGRLVALTLADDKVIGRITGVGDDMVRIDVDGAARDIALADVRKAVVQVELRKDVDAPDDADAADDADAPDDDKE